MEWYAATGVSNISGVLHGKFENLIDVLYFIIANVCLLSNIGYPDSLYSGTLLNSF